MAVINCGDKVTSPLVEGEGLVTAEEDSKGQVRVCWSDGAIYDFKFDKLVVVGHDAKIAEMCARRKAARSTP